MSMTIVASVIAFVVAIFVIKFFMGYISKRSFLPFVVYRVALGVAIIILLSTGVLTPEGGTATSAAAAAAVGGGL